jgi:hypothetical protein
VEKVADGNKDEANKEQTAKPAVYWVDSIAIFSLDMSAI